MVDQNQAESSSVSKLKLKLKISKTTEEETIQIQQQIDESKNHVCKQCNRSFTSGKALGGHMSSAHVQAQANKYLFLKKQKLRKSKKKGYAFGCKICHKVFHSRKSLCGHMKSHPDRDWRGMDPPQDDKSQDSFEDYDADFSYSDEEVENEEVFDEENQVDLGPVMDLSVSLTGWGVKGKRGRQEPDSEPDEDQNELHAVYQLLRLVSSPVHKKAEDVAENRASGSGLGPDKMVVCDENVDPMEKSMSISAGDQDGVEIFSKAKRAKVDEGVNGSDEKTRSATIQEKEFDISVFPTPTPTPGKSYKCNSCEKVFSTYQGLGGHRSSHNNKPKISLSSTIDEVNTNKVRSSSKAKTARGYWKLLGSGKSVPNRQVYDLANVVGRVPYNGQATLFGNESTQGSSVDIVPYGSQATFGNGSTQGSTADRVSSSEQATSADGTAEAPKRAVLLDLNEFPDEDES